jgi:hypothetical protein
MGEDDFEYTDMDEKVTQEKMTERHEKSQEEDDEKEPTLEELDDEPTVLEGGDDEWSKDQEGADLDYKKEEKEEEVEKEEAKEGKVEKEEPTKEEEADAKIKEDMIKYLDDEGGGTKYVIKGKEYDLRDLSPQEFKDRFSKAGRFYERMEELATKEKTLVERERTVEDGARRSQEIMRRYGTEGKADEVKLPKAYEPHEDDTDTERALKAENAELYKRVDAMEKSSQQQVERMTENELMRQLDGLTKEFPMASKEQIVAVMYEYPDANIRQVAENSHNLLMTDEHFNAVLDSRPERLREIEEKAVEKYLAKKQGTTKVSRKRSSSTVSSKSSEKKTRTPRTFDEIEAQEDAMKQGYEDYLDKLND